MPPDTTIEEQARMEAEAKYPERSRNGVNESGHVFTYTDKRLLEREAYAAALIAERSKPQPSVDEVVAICREEFEKARTAYFPPTVFERSLRDRLTKLLNK